MAHGIACILSAGVGVGVGVCVHSMGAGEVAYSHTNSWGGGLARSARGDVTFIFLVDSLVFAESGAGLEALLADVTHVGGFVAMGTPVRFHTC